MASRSIPRITEYNPPLGRTEFIQPQGRTAEKSCEGKNRYNTLKFALQVAMKSFRRGTTDVPLDTYFCPFCQHYHNGHQPGSDRLRGTRLVFRAV